MFFLESDQLLFVVEKLKIKLVFTLKTNMSSILRKMVINLFGLNVVTHDCNLLLLCLLDFGCKYFEQGEIRSVFLKHVEDNRKSKVLLRGD